MVIAFDLSSNQPPHFAFACLSFSRGLACLFQGRIWRLPRFLELGVLRLKEDQTRKKFESSSSTLSSRWWLIIFVSMLVGVKFYPTNQLTTVNCLEKRPSLPFPEGMVWTWLVKHNRANQDKGYISRQILPLVNSNDCLGSCGKVIAETEVTVGIGELSCLKARL
jgi:hypothetical protein